MKSRKKLIVGITAAPSVDLLKGQLTYAKSQGFDVALMAPEHERVTEYCKNEGVRHISISIERNLSLFKDLASLFSIIKILLKEKPDVVNFGTPKVSLLGLIASKLVGVKKRIYTCRGLRYERESGNFRKLLRGMELITAKCAHKIFCISRSVADYGVQDRVFPIKKVRLIKKGSSNGVNTDKFNPNRINKEEVDALKKKYKIENKFVFGFVGRLSDVKGLNEMYEAFNEFYQSNSDSILLIIGRPFWDLISDASIIDKFEKHPGVVMAGFQPMDSIPSFLSLMDCFLMLSKGEGFGNVYIEAAAMGLPIIGTDVTGVRDAVSNGFNGVLLPFGDVDALVNEMIVIRNSPSKREELGRNGIEWSLNFIPAPIWQGYVDLYNE